MAQGNVYYEPTEYEAMLIAAKWISIEDVDTDYQEYKRKNRWDDEATYDGWLSMRRQWDELNAQYEREVEPHYRAYTMTPALERLQVELLNRMSQLETWLGY